MAATRGLVAIDPERSLPALVDMLVDRDPEVLTKWRLPSARWALPPCSRWPARSTTPRPKPDCCSHLASFPTEVAGRIRWFAERQVARARQDAELAAAIVVSGDERWILLRDSLRWRSQREAGNAVRAMRPARGRVPSERHWIISGARTRHGVPVQIGVDRLVNRGRDASSTDPGFGGQGRRPGSAAVCEALNHHDSWIRRCVEFATTPGDEMARTWPPST